MKEGLNVKTLLLITKNYPFDTGEEFVENEIEYLAARFEHVHIIATAVFDATRQTRRVPVNVSVFAITDEKNKEKRAVKYVLSGLLQLSKRSVLEELREAKKIRQKAYTLYFTARVERIIKRVLTDDIALNDENAKIEAVYCFWFNDVATVGVRLKQLLGWTCPVISRAHRYDLYPEKSATGHIPFRQETITGISKVYACSNDGCQCLKTLYSKNAGKFEVAYLGTMERGDNPFLKDARIEMVSCSSISLVKRIDIIVDALKEIAQQNDLSIVWHCIGSGVLLDSIKHMVSQIQSDRIEVVFYGRLQNDEVMNFYRHHSVDLFLNTSASEGLPVSIMEAASFGIPTIGSNVGGTRELIEDGINGYLLEEPVTSQQLANAIRRYSVMPESMVRNMRLAAKRKWREQYNAEYNYNEFAQRIKNLCEG